MAMTEKFWKIIIDETESQKISEDPRFTDFKSRLENRDELTEVLDRVFIKKTVSDWMEIFAGKIPIGPVYDLDQALDNPFVKERGMIQSFSHPDKEKLRTLSNPILVNGERLPVQRAPKLGENSDEILEDLGYSTQEIELMKKNKII